MTPEQRRVLEAMKADWVAIGIKHGNFYLNGEFISRKVLEPLFTEGLIHRGFAGRGILSPAALALLAEAEL